jgi:molecular chaperone GrpE
MAEEPVMTAGADGNDQPNASEPDERLLRALADLDNLRKRFVREVERERQEERARIVAQWLPVVDDLERALEYADTNADPLTVGLRAVYEQALSVLERMGFPRFDDVGEPFDPSRHEAVGAIAADAPAGTVAAATRAGYGTRDDVLRPAAVLVARPAE